MKIFWMMPRSKSKTWIKASVKQRWFYKGYTNSGSYFEN